MKKIIFDLEMTMWMVNPQKDKNELFIDEGNGKKYYLKSKNKEVIQIGAVKLDEDLNIISTFESFIKPKYNPLLTGSCRSYTHINQIDIDSALSFEEVIGDFIEWAYEDDNEVNFYSWNKEDKLQLCKESETLGFEVKKITSNYTDFQNVFSVKYNKFIESINLMSNKKSVYGLKRVVNWMKIPYNDNELHSAIVDATLTAEIFINFNTMDFKTFVNCN